ncbi:MAG: hypothetical protein NC120_09875 [Ruminococcus sp.]|nr:hypothetical protein [Ruminococcus sp.]
MEFMDGVTLIKECTETSSTAKIIVLVIIICAFLLGALLIKLGDFLFDKTGNNAYGIAGLVLSAVIVLTGLLAATKVIPNMEQFQVSNGEYEVVVSNDVDMTEFQRKYEIVDYDNGKYIIAEKGE